MEKTLLLVEKARGGDDRALNDLVHRYSARVGRIVRVRLMRGSLQATDLESLIQKGLTQAIRGLDGPPPGSEGAFVNQFARAVEAKTREAIKERKYGPSAPSAGGSTASRSREEEARKARARKLEDGLRRLEERDGEVILLRNMCKMEFPEIARELRLKDEDAAKQVYRRAVERYKDLTGLDEASLT